MNALSAELAGRPESARAARELVRRALGDHHPSAADAPRAGKWVLYTAKEMGVDLAAEAIAVALRAHNIPF